GLQGRTRARSWKRSPARRPPSLRSGPQPAISTKAPLSRPSHWRKEKGPPKRAFHVVSCPCPPGPAFLDLALLVGHLLAPHAIVLLHCHRLRRVLPVLVGRVQGAGGGGGDQADLVALRGHGRFSFGPSRREHGARRGRRRCRSCRWCAGHWAPRAASPSGS